MLQAEFCCERRLQEEQQQKEQHHRRRRWRRPTTISPPSPCAARSRLTPAVAALVRAALLHGRQALVNSKWFQKRERERERERERQSKKDEFNLTSFFFFLINLLLFLPLLFRLRDRPGGRQGLSGRLGLLLGRLLLRRHERSDVGRGAQALEELARRRGVALFCFFSYLFSFFHSVFAARRLRVQPPRRRRRDRRRRVQGPAEAARARCKPRKLLCDSLRHQRRDAPGGGAQGEGAGADER